jgi:peptidoglycan/LPS O-acetylase OafA/YrhL
MSGTPEISVLAAPDKSGRLRYVDALRGIAALLVLWLHVANSYRALSPETAAHTRWLNDYVSAIDIGRIGVVVFFLISGFVIPFSIRRESCAPVAGFAIRRAFRIFPAYWLSVPLAALVFYWGVGRPFPLGDFLVNLTLLQDVFGVPSAEGVYWTLLVELVFYGLCIALLLSRALFSARRVAALAIVLAAAHVGTMFLRWIGHPLLGVGAAFWFLNLSVMLCGALFRLQATDAAGDRIASTALRALTAFYLIVLPLGTTLAIEIFPNYTVAYALGFLIFIVGTRFVRMETRVSDWLGRISYSIYLFHPIVFQPVHLWLMRQPVDSFWRTQHLGVYVATNLLLTLVAASLVFRFVEQPAIRCGHRLAARFEQQPHRDAASKPEEERRAEVAAGAAAG